MKRREKKIMKACKLVLIHQRLAFQIIPLLLISLQIPFTSSRGLNNYSTTRRNNSDSSSSADDFFSFDIPAPPPSYPPGTGFGQGSIDLGGLEVYEALYFNQIWIIHEGGPDDFGVSFFEPAVIPTGYHVLGHFCAPNGFPLFASVLTAKDTTNDPSNGALKMPTGYTLVWTSEGRNIKKNGEGYIWLPNPPAGYQAAGQIVTTTRDPPSLDRIMCVRTDLTDYLEVDTWLWGSKEENSPDFNVYVTRPKTRGPESLSVYAGTFMGLHGPLPTLGCLKRAQYNFSAMPNFRQIHTIVQAYAPWVYFHPDEEFFPSSVNWFFENGALLYKNGQNPTKIGDFGFNLPLQGSPDDSYIDLPIDGPTKERVKKGDLLTADAYIHVKPALGATYTDIAIWLYYPFNGGGKLQVGPVTISLGKIGEHVSDWEHLTLRIDNFNGRLKRIYLSEHHAGRWASAVEFEYVDGNRPIVYASLHGHAMYTKPDHNLHSKTLEIEKMGKRMNIDRRKSLEIGVRNDTAKGDLAMDVANCGKIVRIDYYDITMQPWLYYTGRWGPKFTYSVAKEIEKVTSDLPGDLKKAARKILNGLPPELFGEEGPLGPAMKPSWTGDEDV